MTDLERLGLALIGVPVRQELRGSAPRSGLLARRRPPEPPKYYESGPSRSILGKRFAAAVQV
jgi:hypothetical protein